MKKILFLLVLSLMGLSLASCQAEGPLRVGMDLRYPPFETVDTQNVPEGISVDIAYMFGTYINREVEIVNMEFGTLITALQTGEIDIAIASMSITEEREKSVDFTDAYFYFKIISLLNKDFADTHNLTSDSSIDDVLAVENAQYVGIASQISVTIPQELGKNVTEAVDVLTAVEEVAQGTADVLFMSANPVADGFKANPNDTMILWDPIQSSPIGMAVQEGDTALLQQANDFIDTFFDEGGVYAQLKASWDQVIEEKLGGVNLDFYIYE